MRVSCKQYLLLNTFIQRKKRCYLSCGRLPRKWCLVDTGRQRIHTKTKIKAITIEKCTIAWNWLCSYFFIVHKQFYSHFYIIIIPSNDRRYLDNMSIKSTYSSKAICSIRYINDKQEVDFRSLSEINSEIHIEICANRFPTVVRSFLFTFFWSRWRHKELHSNTRIIRFPKQL